MRQALKTFEEEGFIPNIGEAIDREARDGSIAFIDLKTPIVALKTAQAAQKYNFLAVMDYGDRKEWPNDPKKANIYDQMLRSVDCVIVPGDAVVKGMEAHAKNPEQLFYQLQHEYNVPNIIMSDGINPVQIWHNNKRYKIDIEPYDGQLYSSCVGDTRDAALVYFLSLGDNFLTAVEKATAVAS